MEIVKLFNHLCLTNIVAKQKPGVPQTGAPKILDNIYKYVPPNVSRLRLYSLHSGSLQDAGW